MLVTKKVLGMEKCRGKTLTKIGKQLMEEVAKSHSMILNEFQSDMNKKMSDPNFVSQIVNRKDPTEAQVALYRGWIVTKDLLKNSSSFAYNWTVEIGSGNQKEYVKSFVPPNAHRLMELSYNYACLRNFRCRDV